MSYWTIEQVAEFLGVSIRAIYESRRRNEFPGIVGTRRGRRLMFPSEAIEAGQQAVEEGREPIPQETTENPTEAILWALQGIHTTLRGIHNELRAQGQQELHDLIHSTLETTVEIEGEDEDE